MIRILGAVALFLTVGFVATGTYFYMSSGQFQAESGASSDEPKPYQPTMTDYVVGIHQYEKISISTIVEIENAPKGMKIISGQLDWKPDKASEGKSYNLTLNVRGDDRIRKSNFSVNVATTSSMKKRFSRSALIIDDERCELSSLAGEKFTLVFNGSNHFTVVMKGLPIDMVTSAVNYHIPPNITQHSCFFKIGKMKQPDTDTTVYFGSPLNVSLIASHKKKLFNQDQGELRLYKLYDRLVADRVSRTSGMVQPAASSKWFSGYRMDAEGLFFIGSDADSSSSK